MIRVGFVLTFDATGWLGGINYFRNLLGAIMSLPARRIEPVILAGKHTDPAVLAQFPSTEVVRSELLDGHGRAFWTRRIAAKLLGNDIGLMRLLRQHRIGVLSHQGFFGSIGAIPIVGWIPDFQELHLPEFFSAAELRARARKRALIRRACACVVVSSDDAKRDLEGVDPECARRARVLRFVANVSAPATHDLPELTRRLGLVGPYFHLPNQFWAHKNHVLVVEALAVLRARGVRAYVAASGNTVDHRQPMQFAALMKRVQDAGLAEQFLTVGVLPHADVARLMAGAIAVINPSRFEGWSTTVEEAKSLGKKVLLSDIGVHREQAPLRGEYFASDDARGLAGLMAHALSNHDPATETRAMQAAQETLRERRHAFASRYQDLLLELVPQ